MEAGTYPLILDGTQAGKVTVHKEGGWTAFDVQCAMMPDIIRVSVFGGEREGYLGVLAPEGDHLALHRRLSRGEMRGFPSPIEFAGRSGQGGSSAPEAEQGKEPGESAPETAAEAEAPQEAAEDADTLEASAEDAETPQEVGNEEAPPRIEDVYWYASPDGALICFDGEHNLIALPVEDQRIPDGPGGWPREIEGRAYIVYRTKDGRLLR